MAGTACTGGGGRDDHRLGPHHSRPVVASGQGGRGGASALVGTGQMLRLALRRDRTLVPAWVLGIAGMATFSAQATVGLYPDLPQRVQAAEAINGSAALIALYGRIYDPTSLGELSLFKMTAFGAAMVGVLMIILVVRHTRAEEETGRLELVGATVMGRAAPLAAGLLLAAIASLGIAVLTAMGLTMAGLPAAGSVAFGAAWGATGLLFAAVGGITAQLSVSARAATGLGLIVLAVTYVARAVGDLAEGGPGWLSWLSPIGWSQQVRAFSGTRWGILVLPLVATVVLGRSPSRSVAVATSAPACSPTARARHRAASPRRGGCPSGCSVRPSLHGPRRRSSWVWSSAASPTASAGSSTPRPWRSSWRSWVGARAWLTPSWPPSSGSSARWWPPTGSSLRTGCTSEEEGGRTENVLATATTRRLGHQPCRLALLGVAVLMALVGLAVGLGHALSVGEPEQVWRLGVAATARIPAAWVMVGLTVAIWGFWPRRGGLAWVLFVAFLLMGEFGVLWDIPEWAAHPQPVRALADRPRPRPVVPGHPGDAGDRHRAGRARDRPVRPSGRRELVG